MGSESALSTPMKRGRKALAFALAPLASGVLQGAVMGNPGAIAFAIPFSYIFAAIVGFPAYLIAERFSLTRFWHYLIVGLLAGVAAGVLLSIAMGVSDFKPLAVAAGMLFLGLHGAIVASVFWMIAYFSPMNNSGNG